MRSLFFHPSKVEREVRRRVKLSIWAYAYDFENRSLVSDAVFDEECKRIDLSVDTQNPRMDAWWRKEFDPSTGMWIRNHPDLKRIKELYNAYYVQA